MEIDWWELLRHCLEEHVSDVAGEREAVLRYTELYLKLTELSQ